MRARFGCAFAVTSLCVLAGPLAAQDSTARVRPGETPPVAAWATLSVGVGYASDRNARLLAGEIGGFVSYGPWMTGYRRGGASGIESSGAYDDAWLVGRRWRSDPTMTYVALGPARVYDELSGNGEFGIGMSAGVGVNAHVIGVGVSGFAAKSRSRWFTGIGLTVDAGWIR